MYHLYRINPSHKWKVSANPPSACEGDDLLHPLSSTTRKAAQMRRAQMNAAIQRQRDAGKKRRNRTVPGNPAGRPATGNAKVRVVLTVPADVAALIPGNKNEYGNRALIETLKKDGII
jgi:hypothetical protein